MYRDHELIRTLLGELEVGDSVSRVAISLDDAKRGPFVVVARDGHFVTCLSRPVVGHLFGPQRPG